MGRFLALLFSALLICQPVFAGAPPFPPGAYVSVNGAVLGKYLFKNGTGLGDSWIAGVSNGASIYSKAVNRGLSFRDRGSFAVAGTRSDQITAQIPAGVASGASFALIDQGINDCAQSVSEQTLENNEIINWNLLIAGGVLPIDMGMPPTNTAGNVTCYLQNEIWRSLWTYKHQIPKLDVYSPLATSTGSFQSGLNQDAVHYNTVGADIVAGVFTSNLQGVNPYKPPILALTDTGSQFYSPFINNAVSWGSVGNTALPSGWTGATNNCGSLLVVAGSPTDIDSPGSGQSFGNWMRCTISGAASLTGFQPTAVTLASLGWTVGDTLGYGFCIRWTDVSQGLTITVISSTQSGVAPIFQEKGGVNGENKCVYAQYVIPAGTTVMALAFQAIGTGYFEVSRPIVVDLTKVGQYNSVLP